MSKWVVYNGGNSEYILSPNKEPIRMLKSFQKHFGDALDYVYFTDENEPRLDEVEKLCDENGIRLMTGQCKIHYEEYKDHQYINNNSKPRWPDAHYWYCEGPTYFQGIYDYAIKCDGDMLCVQRFDLEPLQVENEITAADSPHWYDPYDKFCANAGFQIMNVNNYATNQVRMLFREGARQSINYRKFNSDTPVLNWLVGHKTLNVHFIPAEYNYLLFDIEQVNNLTDEDIKDVKIAHFVDSKPHNLNPQMAGSVKEKLAQIYLGY